MSAGRRALFSKLLSLVRQTVAQLQARPDRVRSEQPKREVWLEQLSDFQWIDGESESVVPAEERKGWLEGMFGSTSPVRDDGLGANMLGWKTTPLRAEMYRKRNSRQGMLLV